LPKNQLAVQYPEFKFHEVINRRDNDDAPVFNAAKINWKRKDILHFTTWNVRGISFKEDQLDDILAKQNIKCVAIPETEGN
jgi:hypothetical protein